MTPSAMGPHRRPLEELTSGRPPCTSWSLSQNWATRAWTLWDRRTTCLERRPHNARKQILQHCWNPQIHRHRDFPISRSCMLVHCHKARLLLSCHTHTQTSKNCGQQQNSQPRSLSHSIRPEVPASNPGSTWEETSPG